MDVAQVDQLHLAQHGDEVAVEYAAILGGGALSSIGVVVGQPNIEPLGHGEGGRLQPGAVVHPVGGGTQGLAAGLWRLGVDAVLPPVGTGVAALVGAVLALADGAHAIECASAGFGHEKTSSQVVKGEEGVV